MDKKSSNLIKNSNYLVGLQADFAIFQFFFPVISVNCISIYTQFMVVRPRKLYIFVRLQMGWKLGTVHLSIR